jgi:hypothetical protein
MTPRVPRTEALIPDELLAKLIENGRTSEEHDGFDPFPVVKLFTPDAGATWLFTEACPDESDVRFAATRFAYGSGAGFFGAGVVGLVAGMASFAVMVLLFATLRAPVLRTTVALIFTAPAVVAGYALVHGLTAEIVPSPIWRQIFSAIGAISTGVCALARLAAPLSADNE